MASFFDEVEDAAGKFVDVIPDVPDLSICPTFPMSICPTFRTCRICPISLASTRPWRTATARP